MDRLLRRPSGGDAPPPLPSYHPSNLSPLAPPFTYSLPSPAQWSIFNTPGAASYHPPSSQPAGIAPACGDASYPLPEPEEYRWDRPFGGVGAGRGRERGGEGSSWLEPSLGFKAPAFQEGKSTDGLVPIGNSSDLWHGKYVGSFAGRLSLGSEYPEWLNDKYPTTHEEDAIGPFNISRQTILDPSSLPKQNSYTELPDSRSAAFMVYPTTACSTSVHAHAPSSRNSPFGEFSMFENGYSMFRPIDTYKSGFGFEDYASNSSKEINDNQNSGLKVDYDEMGEKNNMEIHTSMPVDTFSLKTSLPPGSELAKGNPIDTLTDVDSGLKLKSLNIQSTFISETGPAEPNNSIGTSSEALDQINVSVDSPCWKGALVSRQSLFSIAETVNLNSTVKELYNLDQDQKHRHLGLVSSEIPPSIEQVGSLICNDNKKISDFSLKGYPVILPSIQKHVDDVSVAAPSCLTLNRKDKKHWSGSCKEQSNGVRNEQNECSEENDKEETPLGKKKIVSAIQPITVSGAANLETDVKPVIEGNSSDFDSGGETSFLGNDRELLIKTIQNLSEVLLSPCNGGINELKENERELLEMAVHNLEAFTLRSKKAIASGSFHVSAPEAAGSKDIGSKTDVEKQTNNITTHVMEGKVHSSDGCILSEGGIKESSKISSVAQTFGNVLEKTLFEQEENPQALVYKNLWIEAEAALCSMKYELQLARMKIEMENHGHITRGKSPQVPDSSNWNSMHEFDWRCTPQEEEGRLSGNRTPHRAGAEYNSYRNLNKSPLADANKKEEFDAATLARLRILKSRIDYPEPTIVEHQPCISLIEPCIGAKETMGVPLTEGESNVILENLPPKLSVSVFTESSKSQSNIVNFSLNKGKDEANLQFRKYITEFFSSDLENTAAGESDAGNVNRAAIKPDTPTGQGRRSPAGGYGSPTSEWEHVLKEDFTL